MEIACTNLLWSDLGCLSASTVLCGIHYSRKWRIRKRSRRSGLLQPRAWGASLKCLLLHGLQGGLGCVDLLLDLLQGLRLLQHIVPLPPHNAFLSTSYS